MTPSPSPSPVVIAPDRIDVGEDGTIAIEINADALPEGAISVQLPSGEIVKVTDGVVHFTVNQEDMGEDGTIYIVAIGDEEIPLGYYVVQVKGLEMSMPDTGRDSSPLIWILIGIGVVGFVMCVIYLVRSRKRTH